MENGEDIEDKINQKDDKKINDIKKKLINGNTYSKNKSIWEYYN